MSTSNFIKSMIQAYPKIEALSTKVQKNHNLIINYPLKLQQSSKRNNLISESRIQKGNDLLLLSSQECIFSSGFSGASARDQSQINQKLVELSSQYDSINAQFIEKMKIYVQILANKQDLKTGAMPLSELSNYILNSPQIQINKSQINSRFLYDIYQSWEINQRIVFNYLNKQFLKRIQQQQFLNVCSKGKHFIRYAGNSQFYFIAPFLDHLDHSFDPNCEFQMIYFPHRRTPFIRIKTLRPILPGERPSICFGKFNNYELLLRYGFTVENNPHSIFMLPLNYEDISQSFSKNIEWKQQMFIREKIKLKNFIKVLPNGKIHPQDLKMLRIITNEDSKPNEKSIYSQVNDVFVHKFVANFAKNIRKNLKINNLKNSEDPDIKRLEWQQENILDNFITNNTA